MFIERVLMNVKRRRDLKEQQNNLMRTRKEIERIQRNHSDDEIIYKTCERLMNKLNDDADKIRRELEQGGFR